MRPTTYATVVVCLTACASKLFGAPIGVQPLSQLLNKAEVVFVGRIIQGVQSDVNASAIFQIERMLKGSSRAGTVPASFSTLPAISGNKDLRGQIGIWFLTKKSDGSLEVMPPFVGAVPVEFHSMPALAALPASWMADPSASTVEKVIRELAAALEQLPAGSVLWSALLSQPLTESDPSLSRLYQRLQSSGSEPVAAAGLKGSIVKGDLAALQSLASRAQRGLSNASSTIATQAVCEFSNGNPRALAVLAEMAAMRSQPELRRCAVLALRTIHSRETIQYLLPLLDDTDSDIRYQAMAGIASYANTGFLPGEKQLVIDGVVTPRNTEPLYTPETGANFPTGDRFRLDEPRVIAFWKQWVRVKVPEAVR